MLKKIIVAVAVIVVLILLFATAKPDTFQIQRSATMKAPPEKIMAMLDDFHNWGAWSPWEKLDPAMQRTFSGSASGKGAAYAWKGNSKAGEGRMEIMDVAGATGETVKLDFVKPFEAHNTVEFRLQPKGDSTTVGWTMFGTSPYVSKVFQVFVSMDKLVGKDFDTGLANLKAAVEK